MLGRLAGDWLRVGVIARTVLLRAGAEGLTDERPDDELLLTAGRLLLLLLDEVFEEREGVERTAGVERVVEEELLLTVLAGLEGVLRVCGAVLLTAGFSERAGRVAVVELRCELAGA